MWPFSDFQDGFQSSQSTADLFTVVSDRISWCFNRYGTTRAGAVDISKLLTGFVMLVFFKGLSIMKFQVRYLAFILMTFLIMLSVILHLC